MEHVVEDSDHGSLVSVACNLETKGHDRLIEVPYRCSKNSLLSFIWVHSD